MNRHASVEVYAEIKASGILSKRRQQVYDILYQYGPMTGGQVAQRMKVINNIQGYSESVRNRLTELRNMGGAVEVGEKICPVTGRNSILWEVSGKFPNKMERKKAAIFTACIEHQAFMQTGLTKCGAHSMSLFPCNVVRVKTIGGL